MGEVLRAAVDEVCKYEPENQGVDLLRKSLQKVFAKTLGDRDYGIFEAVHVGLRLPLVFSLLDCVSLNTAGARVLRPMRQIQEGADDAPVTWDSKVDKFDDRWKLVEEKQSKTGKLTQADVAHTSLYEFWWKFRLVQGKLVRENPAHQRVLMVTPGFSADCASVLSDRHSDYARAAVIAHWRMMPTEARNARLTECAVFDAPRLDLSDPVRTILWGATGLQERPGRHLGVQDLVAKFDTEAVDSKGRKLGWAMALMEMLVDPMLMCWVPDWLHEQYERWNPFFRPCVRQANDTCADETINLEELVEKRVGRRQLDAAAAQKLRASLPKERKDRLVPNPYFLKPGSRANRCFLRLVRRRMILRALRDKAANAEGDDVFADRGDVSEDDGRDPADAPRSESSGDEGPERAAEALREAVEMIRDELPTADGVEQLEPGSDGWASATAEQRLSAASSAVAAPDVSLGAAPGGLHADGASVNPRGYAWHLMVGNVDASAHTRLKQSWASWREAGAAAKGDGRSFEELDVWARFACKIACRNAQERDSFLHEGGRLRGLRRTKPLRMILTGGAGSGKSTTVRALVRARRERTDRLLRGVRNEKRKRQRMRFTCILSSPTGTASFQMKYGATTAHRAWGVGPFNFLPLKVGNPAVERLRDMVENGDLAVFDEFSMLGKAFLGKVLYRAREVAPGAAASLGGLDCIKAGHLAQAAPIGDDPVFKPGGYSGKSTNRAPEGYRVKEPPTTKALMDDANLFLTEFEDVVMLLETHRVDEDGEPGWSEERLAQYRQDAKRFLEVTRRMADLEWTREDWRFLARRNASALLSTAEGRAEYEREFKDAPLLMDTRQQTAKQEDGADRYNAERLERLAREKDLPILAIRAVHQHPAGSDPARMEAEDFRGLKAEVRLGVGARVFLTTNEWVEAGLVNGAAGYVRGFMLPAGFDPNASSTKLCTPLAVIVEFDEVNLDGPCGEKRCFFSEPGRERWVPIYHSAPVSATTDSDITRAQFPLTLAWALTHWKAQGMTLRRARICMRRSVAGAAGVGYVAVTRVKHVEHLVFEEDLPAWEDFQLAKTKPTFRQRRRMELRLLARFSRTLRKYGFCERDPWPTSEAEAAEALLKVLRAGGARELEAARLERGRVRPSEDAWPWPPAGPDVAGEVRAAVGLVCEDGRDADLVRAVAERLQGELHLPAVREALRCLIPEMLDSTLDGQQKKAPRGDVDRVGVKLSAKGWGVDVSAESVLRAGQAMRVDVLEFFLIVLRHVCEVLELPVYVGSHKFGERVGGCLPVERARALIESWKQFGGEEKNRVRDAEEFLVPVCYDPEGSGVRWDWVFARVAAAEAGTSLNLADALRTFVADRHGRPGVARRVGERLLAVLPLPGYFLLRGGAGPETAELVPCPGCENRQDAVLGAFGLLSARVAELAGVPCMPATGATFVRDVRAAAAEAFAHLREKVDGDARGDRDVLARLADREACLAWLRKLVSKPALLLRGARLTVPQRVALLEENAEVAPVEPCTVLTWNVNQKDRPKSAQAPEDDRVWSAADNAHAIQAEVLRLQPDVVSLQEWPGEAAATRLAEQYALVGAKPGHSAAAGSVHLYVKNTLAATAWDLRGVPGVACTVRLRGADVAFVALHLEAGEAGATRREKHLRSVFEAARAESQTLVVLGDLNLRDPELVELLRKRGDGIFASRRGLPLQEAAYSRFSWHPQVNRYSPEEGYASKQAARFDRVLFAGGVFGCAYLAGKRKHFAAGSGFFLSDHFAVLALLDVDAEHGRPDRKETLLRRRRAGLVRLREQAAVAENQGDLEANRVGREEAGLMRQRAAEEERADVEALRRAARAVASKRLEDARGAAFGQESLFPELRLQRLRVAAARPSEGGAREMPSAPAALDVVALRGLPGGDGKGAWAHLRAVGGSGGVPLVGGLGNPEQRSCFANALVQVLLRLPAVALWRGQCHTGVCDAAPECVACLLWRSREALGRRPAAVPMLVAALDRLPLLCRFGDGAQHDLEEFCCSLLAALRGGELAAGRFAEWHGFASGDGRAAHVDRLFGFVLEQRRRCLACGGAAEVSTAYGGGLMLHLPVPEGAGCSRVWTATELYYARAAPSDVECFCAVCGGRTVHREQAHLATQPCVLLLHVGRRRAGAATCARHAVQPELVLTLPGHDRYELAAVVYHRGRDANHGHYYCVSRAHDGRWWRFDDASVRVFSGDVERSELRSVYMLVYTLPRGVARFAHMGPLQMSAPSAGRGVQGAPAAGAGASRVVGAALAAAGAGAAEPSCAPAPRLVTMTWAPDAGPGVARLASRRVQRDALLARSAAAARAASDSDCLQGPSVAKPKVTLSRKVLAQAARDPAQRRLSVFSLRGHACRRLPLQTPCLCRGLRAWVRCRRCADAGFPSQRTCGTEVPSLSVNRWCLRLAEFACERCLRRPRC